MPYLRYKGKAYSPETGEEITLDYYITGTGLTKEQKDVFNEILRRNFNLSGFNRSLIDLVNEVLEGFDVPQISKKSLENIIRIHKPAGTNAYYPRKNISDKWDLETFLESSKNEFEVDYLGGGNDWKILGMYDPSTDTVYVLRNLPSHIKTWVYAHERAHRRRHYSGESQNEVLVDQEATSSVGYNPFPNRHYGQAA